MKPGFGEGKRNLVARKVLYFGVERETINVNTCQG
jgi:hypothetical protein